MDVILALKTFKIGKGCKDRMSQMPSTQSDIDGRSAIIHDRKCDFERNTQAAIQNLIDTQKQYPFCFHFSLTFMDYVDICNDKTAAARIIETQGLIVPENVFPLISGNIFDKCGKEMKKSSQGEDVKMYFSIEILVSNNNDVERFCSISHTRIGIADQMNVDDLNRFFQSKFPGSPHIDESAFNYMNSADGRAFIKAETKELTDDKCRELQREYMLALRTCHVCKARKPKLPSCSKCKKVYYCGVECQRKDWSRHRNNECIIKKIK